mmetsp:Transcript_14305/g.39780  ORF Transcript_14305/g.39780 Transcript_14305/m.39780 type:complete len:243 (+) Transcript_14305:58-786(+)
MRLLAVASGLLMIRYGEGFVPLQVAPIKAATPIDSSTTSLQAQRFNLREPARSLAAGFLVASSVFFASGDPAVAADARILGQIQGSGLVFKDTLQIESFDDPKVKGVTLYVSNFQRPLTERLTSNFLADPSYASVSCAKTGPVSIADNIAKGKGGEQVFDESRSLFFKTLRVQRIFDEEKNTVVYVSYSTRLDKGDDTNKSRFKSSLCAVNLDEPKPAVAAIPAATKAAVNPAVAAASPAVP